jgi:hypothetical protein
MVIMPGRPCRPSADTKELWRLLLPGMNAPACGVGDEAIAAGEGNTAADRVESVAPPAQAFRLSFSIISRTLLKIRR